MPCGIKHEVFRQAGCFAGFPELLVHRCEVPLYRLRWKNPTFPLFAATDPEQLQNPVAHGNVTSFSRSLAVWNEDHSVVPVQILNAHPEQLFPVAHARVTQQNDDIPQRLVGIEQ